MKTPISMPKPTYQLTIFNSCSIRQDTCQHVHPADIKIVASKPNFDDLNIKSDYGALYGNAPLR